MCCLSPAKRYDFRTDRTVQLLGSTPALALVPDIKISLTTEECERNKDMKVIVLAVIAQNGRVLIVQRARASSEVPGLSWVFPGGKVEEGETLEQALRREVQEETGLHVNIGTLVHARIVPNTNILALFYLCTLAKTAQVTVVPDPKEVIDFKWATGQEVLSIFGSNAANPVATLLLDLDKGILNT